MASSISPRKVTRPSRPNVAARRSNDSRCVPVPADDEADVGGNVRPSRESPGPHASPIPVARSTGRSCLKGRRAGSARPASGDDTAVRTAVRCSGPAAPRRCVAIVKIATWIRRASPCRARSADRASPRRNSLMLELAVGRAGQFVGGPVLMHQPGDLARVPDAVGRELRRDDQVHRLRRWPPLRSSRRHAAACANSSSGGYHLKGTLTRSVSYPCSRSWATSSRTSDSAPPRTNGTCASQTRILRKTERMLSRRGRDVGPPAHQWQALSPRDVRRSNKRNSLYINLRAD